MVVVSAHRAGRTSHATLLCWLSTGSTMATLTGVPEHEQFNRFAAIALNELFDQLNLRCFAIGQLAG
ncbi:hypothetical protein DIJ64_01845 [Mycobacterium leprae]|uniref:Uncharacterized protein n=1 Tax=Mycobacterium leprae TaxID=1769 RepID=A0AAD0KRF5_MYCLR|nr:hypothetical protein DIJ64_01845 [Mycobacterium leprae]OAR21512.1 hypothetical protein A8144_05780 [Mycobacterium leprae 3125609]OAX70261.1 hypothetical protein A3216_12960 [Mycobacterium leprae 7935681]